MPIEISEARFEQDIEASVLRGGPDAEESATGRIAEPQPGYGAGHPGGYHQRRPEQYDRSLCLIPDDLVGFVQATQPETWEKLREHHGNDVRADFVKRVSGEIRKRGTLKLLRDGVKMTGRRIRLAYFRPVSGLNEALRTLYEGNIFSVVRQLKYSERNENSLDLALFLNGIPLFTAELKTHLTAACSTANSRRRSRRSRRSGAWWPPSRRAAGSSAAGLIAADLDAEGDGEPIPAIDGDDGQGEVDQLLFGEVLAHLLIERVRYVVRRDERDGLGPGQRGALALGVERRLGPGGEDVEALFALAGGARILAVHVQAVGTAVELGCPHLDQLEEQRFEAARVGIALKAEHRIQRSGCHAPVIQPALHDLLLFS